MSGASTCAGGMYARFRYDVLAPPSLVLGVLTSAMRDCSGFCTGWNEVSVITSKTPKTNALGLCRVRIATQLNTSVSARAPTKSGEARGAAA